MWLYTLFIFTYGLLVRIISPFYKKAALWVSGRRNNLQSLRQWRSSNKAEIVWVHCASLGEFEQGRPIIERIKKNHPNMGIMLTFYSPSGYEVRKKYAGADWVGYLPNDTPGAMRAFLKTASPKAAIFVKYEYWPTCFRELKKMQIPLYMVSAILRPNQRFFGFFKSFWQPVLKCVSHFFVQNEETARLLTHSGIANFEMSGDTRFDRVWEITQTKAEDNMIPLQTQKRVLVAGSTWPIDDAYLLNWWKNHHSDVLLVIAPHDISTEKTNRFMESNPQAICLSNLTEQNMLTAHLIYVDSMGKLAGLYQFADIVYIGGGFGKGIHNTLEAAVWGKPIVFGPKFQKFQEAKDLVQIQGAFAVQNELELSQQLESLLKDEPLTRKASLAGKAYVESKLGATESIVKHLVDHGILK